MPSQLAERESEKVISRYRKGRTKADAQFESALGFANQIAEHYNGSFSRKQAEGFLRNNEEWFLKDNPGEIGLDCKQRICDALKAFCSQDAHNDFLTYLQDGHFQTMTVLNQLVFDCFKVPRALIEKTGEAVAKKPWNEISPLDKEIYENNGARTVFLNYI